jgi:hypothetical protein
MSEDLNSKTILSPNEFKKKLENNIFFLKKEYGVSLTNGRHSVQEKRFCKTLQEIEEAFKITKDPQYREIKNDAKLKYSNLVVNCKKHGSRYGGLKEF